ncbi:hypothetical protein CMUS01_02927 [Colletotrichum musicola]|uniref:Uncharacterized protein n=1 Tax=Colletotrichum musicola TaxID=2175873 RepID=A0A8H6NU44_9PEZI|nr:hypothetical protein CMUS01_02927 [Colletotrichum musicola]
MPKSEDNKSERASQTKSFEPTLLQWPSSRLESGSSRPLELFLNTLSALMAVVIIVYVGFLFINNGRDIAGLSPMWKFIHEFSKLGPTVVPLMFAFVLGRTVRSYAHWRLQNGERIGFLDSLLGSTTMTGTVTTMIDSRHIGISSLVLALVWSLSPLGGQATLRVLLQQPEAQRSSATLPYLGVNTPFPSRFIVSSFGGLQIPVNALFTGSLGASSQVRNSTLDSWGNVKIPMMERLPGYKGPGSKDWVELGEHPESAVYSSLLGIPIAGLPGKGESTFSLETSYMTMDCDLRSGTMDNDTTGAGRIVSDAADQCDSHDLCYKRFTWGAISTIQEPANSTLPPRCEDPQVPARKLLYYNQDNERSTETNYTASLANCTLSTSYVEVRIACSGWDCAPTAVRPSTLTTNPCRNITFLDSCGDGFEYATGYFLQLFETVTERGYSYGRPSVIQNYLVDPDLALNASAVLTNPPVHSVGGALFSTRLAQLLNTYWTAVIAPEALFLGHPEDFGRLSNQTYNTTLLTTEATVDDRVETLRYDAGWMAVLVVSVAVLLAAAAAGLALDLRIRIPRLLMNVSTMTRGNPNFGVPVGGGALSDEKRARLLADVRVRFGETEVRDGQYDLVIGDCAEHGGRVATVTKGRVYG